MLAVGLTFSRVSMRCLSSRFSVRRRWGWGENGEELALGRGFDVPNRVTEPGDNLGTGE